MKLVRISLSNFRSFGPDPVSLDFDALTFLIGPNGAGKTAVLAALCRMFGTDPALRQVTRSDFHVPMGALRKDGDPAALWMEADFTFSEASGGPATGAVPVFFTHMQLADAGQVPRMRIRLTAELDETGEIEQRLEYVLAVDSNGEPLQVRTMARADRQAIQVHYLPARRNPADHVSYAAGSLIGRMLRAADWSTQREKVAELTAELGEAVATNAGVEALGRALAAQWAVLHTGDFYTAPGVAFAGGALDQVLRHVSVTFGPGHGGPAVDFSRLSDGQQSLFYLSMVLGSHSIGAAVMNGTLPAFDIDRLRPPVFTLMAMEEPENSLSPHYLGRAVASLRTLSEAAGGQAVVATHAPGVLRRADPRQIRYLRLNTGRQTTVRSIVLPDKADQAHKFVREAVMAYPELYFSRLVVLGEGDSEEIVLPRLLAAHGVEADAASVCIAPLGGRHVEHFWRLLHGLGIPYVTLLDFDLGRYGGGWGRIKVAHKHLRAFPVGLGAKPETAVKDFPGWDSNDTNGDALMAEIRYLEAANIFFSTPLDLDLSMLRAYPDAYGVQTADLVDPDGQTVRAVLGKKGVPLALLKSWARHFDLYHDSFKLKSKPASHLNALARMDDETIRATMPTYLRRLVNCINGLLKGIPE